MTSLAIDSLSNGDPARHVSRVDGLYSLKNNTAPAVIWDRIIPKAVETWFDEIDPDTLPWARVNLMVRDVASVVRQACDESGLPDSSERDWFIEDVATIADCFARMMAAHRLQIRFDIVTGNSCKNFHTDMVKARLICTYRGPGTQYGTLTGGQEPDRIYEVLTGCPIVLRGTRWPGTASANFRHRSPPIEGLGMTRLNLVLDALDHEKNHEGDLNIHPEWVRDDPS